MAAVGGERLERRHDAAHHVWRRRVPRFAQNLGRELRQLAKCFAPCVEPPAELRGFTCKLRSLRVPELLACRKESIECAAMLPVQLIGNPCGNRRFRELLNPAAFFGIAVLLQLRSKRVSCRGERGKRQTEQFVLGRRLPYSRHWPS